MGIPLFFMNINFTSFEHYQKIEYPDQKIARKVMYDWWRNERDNFTIQDFFTYGKPYDCMMTKYVPHFPPPIGIE